MRGVQLCLLLLLYFAFLLFRWLFGVVQSLWWLLNGTYFSFRQNRSSYKQSAQVLNIWWRWRYSEVAIPVSLMDFITVHQDFVHPSTVLRDNVTLYNFTKSCAVFVEVDEGVDVTNSTLGSFMKVAQFQYAKKVIILPMKSFHKLAEDVGGPKGPLVFLANTGRCGSTLLCQILEETQKWVALAEPEVINSLSILHGSMDDTEFEKLTCNMMRLLCKPLQTETKGYLIKIATPAMVAVLLPLHKFYPDAKLLFMYRDGIEVAKSFTRMVQRENSMKMFELILSIFPTLQKHITSSVCGFSTDKHVQTHHSLSLYFMVWALTCATYKEMRLRGIPIAGVRYEDMLLNPAYATRAILKNILDKSEMAELVDSLVKKGLKAFGRDSQRDTIFSRRKLEGQAPDKVTPEIQLELETLCKVNNLPTIPEPCILPGTITSP